VASIAIASPPQSDFGGLPHPTILATCELLGITEVYAVGGAQAIALFAYGMENLCEKCDLVTGPGNIYVAAAKRALRGIIGIDSEAGPTEIAIVADESAIAADVAADLISQAEHDVIAAAVLITNSEKLIDDVQKELSIRVPRTKHSARIKEALTGIQSACVLVDSTEHGVEVANAYAAEHLEIQTKNSAKDSERIRNAGAVLIGRFSPVSLGDYSAGSNHVLPTGGCAVLITYCPLAVAHVTQVAYQFKLSCVDYISSNTTKAHLLILRQQLSRLLIRRIFLRTVKL